MSSYVLVDRVQFAFTVTFHYMFPILTMGLGLFIACLKTVSYLGRPDRRFRLLRKSDEERDAHESAARFWAKIFSGPLGSRLRRQLLRHPRPAGDDGGGRVPLHPPRSPGPALQPDDR